MTYNKDGPDYVKVTITQNLQENMNYTAEINVSTAVNWTAMQFRFGKHHSICYSSHLR